MVNGERCLSQILRVSFISLIFLTMFFGFAFAQTVILNQVPDQVTTYASNSTVAQVVADNFILSSPATITQIKIWGIYYDGNVPGTDHFTVIFHADSGVLPHLPDAVISTQNNVPATHQLTGGSVGGYDEYVFTLTLATPVTLAPGTYWVEIYNDVTGTSNHFYWESGTVDSTNGISGSAYAHTVPGSSWSSLPNTDFAIEITKESPATAVPTMTEWGMLIFVVLAGIGSAYFLRRKEQETK